ncbi:histidinol-phosphatase HisJ family protein [uncultured Clostridium sp.]|uniref:histidinol-phosphatase HisJ family protein n=1 Tax=uncultured Clostridium sp. TaxID=59620 RepID=UPI00261A67EF|nr:histidinol-phosphatase HisJ family protein [uncultured Clostridium sp.]
MIFDTHMHTELSSDSEMKISSIIQTKDALNIGVILTDHLDLNYYKKNEFRVDLDKFFTLYSPYRNDSLLLGVEIGLSSSILLENQKISSNYPFDFIIGSVHSVKDEDIYLTYSTKGLSRDEYFNTYFEEAIKYIQEFSNFDSLGHIDYPCRYCNFSDNNFSIIEHGKYLKKIFSILIKRNQALEINTRRLNLKEVYPSTFEIYKFYAECGGKYVTLGSDAHTKDAISTNFNIALALCKELSLTPVYFKNRKMIEIKDI